MQFRTALTIPKYSSSIDYNGQILMLGSCFAVEMYRRMKDLKFDVFSNPQGILYNPISIANSLIRLLERREMLIDELQNEGDKWYSWENHGSFSGTDRNLVISNINRNINSGADYISSADWLILTLGTAFVYEHKDSASVVGNCHKQPDSLFDRKLISVDDIVLRYSSIIDRINIVNPKIKVLISVSPIRHLSDGIVENSRSKAILINAVHQLIDKFDHVYYFPSYELMIDDLRDYRFYKRDRTHPSEEAVDYIWELFRNSLMTENTRSKVQKVIGVQKSLQHRPLHPNTKEYKVFLESLILNMKGLKSSENLDFSLEIDDVVFRLNQL